MGTPAPGCNGTVYNILAAGEGASVKAGATVTVHATGVIKETGKKFWSTKDPGQEPFTYQAGVGQVIKGWDQGLLGMQLGACAHIIYYTPLHRPATTKFHMPPPRPRACAGETRQVIIPAHEGYGAAGFPAWGIPPGGTLDFTLEVLSIS